MYGVWSFMDDQRIENLLNLALDSTEEERDKSLELNVGFDEETRTWDLIVRYHGDIMRLADETVSVTPLLGGYAIITLPEALVDALADVEEIEYIEKPKRLFFSVNAGKQASCITPVQQNEPYLTGRGVLIAVIDSGIDYTHADFRNEDGSTRIEMLWDQTVPGNPPEGYPVGTVYSAEQINLALSAESAAERMSLLPSRDISGHGTAVAGIAAGGGRESEGRYTGVAPQSRLLVVKLGSGRELSFPRTTELMMGIDFVVRQALFLGKPLAVNLSFGNSYGSHAGNSLLETYIDTVCGIGANVFCIGTGNEGAAGGHTSDVLQEGRETIVELAVSEGERTLNVQLWKQYVDSFAIELQSPTGNVLYVPETSGSAIRQRVDGTELLIYYGEPSPYATAQEIYLDFLPKGQFIDSGIWRFILRPRRIVDGRFQMYLPSASVLNTGTRFIRPTPETTLTIPSTASRPVAVGAYDTVYHAYAGFSGRGYTAISNQVKPDIVAPGVNITTTRAGGGYASFTGTSFAAPFAAGSAALLMEWGLVRGNDAYLYGEKVKAYFQRGARHLPGYEQWPNPQVGWGALCVADSLPI